MTWLWVFRCAHVLNVGVICAWHVGQTLQAKLNQSDFQCLLVPGQKSVRTRENRWKSAMVSFMRNGYVRPSSWTKKRVPFCIIMRVCIQVLLSSGCQQWFYISFSWVVVIDFYCRHRVCARFHCNQRPFPIPQSYSLLFHFSNTWHHCFPCETYFNAVPMLSLELSSSTRCCCQLELHPSNASVSAAVSHPRWSEMSTLCCKEAWKLWGVVIKVNSFVSPSTTAVNWKY